MTEAGLNRATEIREEIAILKSEIRAMEPDCKTKITIPRIFRKRKGVPDKRTVNNYWESDRCRDSIGSVIVLSPDEVDLVRKYKEARVELLSREFEELG